MTANAQRAFSVVGREAAEAASAPEGGTEIAIDGASKTFRRGRMETHALDGVELTIGAGEFVAIVGPSGCGKSTLMRLVAGLLPPSSGRVVIGGETVDGPYTNLGIVFQKPILLEWRTILKNVLLQTEMRHRKDPGLVDRAKGLLAAVGLEGFENRFPHELSGGMQQRVAIVRALIHEPPVLLMDEPFGALDALTREQMRIDLEELWLASRKTVLFITHSIDEAVLLADRVVVMSPRPGKIERIVDLDMPRPRGLEGRKDPDFIAAVESITQIFLARGVLHGGRKGPKLVSA
ncbi:ABC transporter ATP-binding protein [Microbaculum marinum]|uniref:ABC transporter ATP-binding protein n=1 Tax=Microbaculum marinum TaxID=1764581 RepID=A0AAW9RP01_9HYPH